MQPRTWGINSNKSQKVKTIKFSAITYLFKKNVLKHTRKAKTSQQKGSAVSGITQSNHYRRA